MGMFWQRTKDGQLKAVEENDLADIEFKPAEFKKELDKTIEIRFTELASKQDEKLEPILEMAELARKDREERAAAEAKKKSEEEQKNSENDDTDFLLDPEAAVNKKLAPRDRAITLLASRQMIQDVLTEQPYFHGAGKEKTMAYINSLPLNQRADTASLMNCYKLAVYDLQSDIEAGKLQKRNNSFNFEGGSTGGHKAESDANNETLSQEEKHMARQMGLTEKAWIDSRKELSFV